MTFLAALRCDRVAAPCVIDGPINATSFRAYIEQFQVFSKLKTLLRKADPRTIEATWKQIGTLLDRFTPQECDNYLVNAGYASV